MAVNYAERFAEIGKLIKKSDALLTIISGLDADRDEIEDAYEANDQTHVIDGISSRYTDFKQQLVNFRNQFKAWAQSSLLDRDDFLEQLPVVEQSLADLLRELIRDMNTNGQSVEESVVALSDVVSELTNHGVGVPPAGICLIDKVLDGYSQPAKNSIPHLEYDGLDSELCVPSETQYLTCVSDSQADGEIEGEEQFAWIGKIADQDFGFEADGSGQGPTVKTINASTILDNRNFEDFTDNVPTTWEVVAGVAGTHIFQCTDTARIFRGSSCLEFRGDGVQESIEIKLPIDVARLQPRRRYLFALAYLVDLAVDTGDFTARFEGSGYNALPNEQITIAAANLESTWQMPHFWITMPEIIPSDLHLHLRWANTPRANHQPNDSSSSSGTEDKGEISMFIDSLAFGPVDYHGGVAAAVLAGRTRFVRGDRFWWTVTNTEGVVQRFFRRAFGVQLPSSDSPTIADTVAT